MANPLLGEVELKAGGKTYILCFSINAIIALEEKMGEKVNAILPKLSPDGDADFKIVRAVLWALLVDRQPEMTIDEAGRLMPAGGFPELTQKLELAIQRAMPQASADENPQTASPDGTGKGS